MSTPHKFNWDEEKYSGEYRRDVELMIAREKWGFYKGLSLLLGAVCLLSLVFHG